MREPVVTVQVDTGVSVITAEPLATPRVVAVLALHHMVCSLEECLFNIEDTIDVEHGHDVEGHVFEQVNVVLIVVHDPVQELEDDVEGHLD